MTRTVALVPLVALLAPPLPADEPARPGRPAAELLSAGVARAKTEDKRVLVLFGSPG